ncbi:hypothetical protein [Pseudomonas chlororaphis]|uniref:hypothetical protein n=1 Tax=Pseudomonas chlororaphis TaxID=587753 RepID=UPI000F6F2B50|nr:hypothetical protein [Pseudomonas chlororaphis]AZC95869.1 hypothetical protein C4K28_3141 [Pseudomonas chlororaphis subsp. piscium]
MAIRYKGFDYQTKLMAQWAVFFELAGWESQPASVAVGNWMPDFEVGFECSHSECSGSHSLFVSVLAIDDIETIQGYPALEHVYGVQNNSGVRADAGAVFGNSPLVTTWCMAHGNGSGVESVPSWVTNADQLWSKAHAILHSLHPGLSLFAQRCLGSEYVCKSWSTKMSPHFLLDNVTTPTHSEGRVHQALSFSNGGVFKASWKPDGTDMKVIELSNLALDFLPGSEEGTYSLEFSPV